MSWKRGPTAAMVGAVFAVSLLAPVAPASAQGFFEQFFGAPIRRSRDFPPPPKRSVGQPAQKRAAPARISAPSYYSYKADSLRRVEVALPVVAMPAAFDPGSLAGADFRAALALVGDASPAAERDVADAIEAHYAADPRFIWVSGFSANGRAEAALRVLGDAAAHGLEPADYSVGVPSAGFAMDDMQSRLAALIRFELTMSARVLRYVRDAARGRVDPNRLSGYHDLPLRPLDLRADLEGLQTAADAGAFLEARHPQSAHYRALRVELEALRASAENDIVVDPKMLLKPGGTHPDLPGILQLIERKADEGYRAQFGAVLALNATSIVYGGDLVPAVKAAQEAAGLKGDGVIGPRTVEVFAGMSRADRIGKVEVAMEQLRWLPADFGRRHVFINQPAYVATYVENETDVLSMRVVVGSPSNQTSFFSDEIETVDYNPYWGVPQSIIVNEMLPRLRNDPGYLDRAGYEVTDAKGRRVPSSAVNWGAYGSKVPFSVRQTPSEANALGELKILFPNKHAIYMHDTPQKQFFARDMRALSHGCVRLQDPRGMAAAVLGSTLDHVEAKLKAGHSGEKLAEKVPVHVAYFTAWPDRSGKVEYFADVYDRDARVMKAIETTEAVRLPAG